MLDDPRSPGIREHTAPPPPKSRLVGERTADVVGAGCTGCSAALHLAQARARVVVVAERKSASAGPDAVSGW